MCDLACVFSCARVPVDAEICRASADVQLEGPAGPKDLRVSVVVRVVDFRIRGSLRHVQGELLFLGALELEVVPVEQGRAHLLRLEHREDLELRAVRPGFTGWVWGSTRESWCGRGSIVLVGGRGTYPYTYTNMIQRTHLHTHVITHARTHVPVLEADTPAVGILQRCSLVASESRGWSENRYFLQTSYFALFVS